MKRTIQDIQKLQSLPLELKIRLTQARIRQWVNEYGEDGVYISFSGGKDSTVLLHIVREMYPNIPAVFFDTGLEYPEIRNFVNSFPNVEIMKPKMNFKQVVMKYGYPIVSKEVSKRISDFRHAKKHGKYYDQLIQMFDGTLTDKNGKVSVYNISKWKKLLDAPFNISSMCCQVMKKNPAKEYYKLTGRVAFTAQLASESKFRTCQWLLHGCNMFDRSIPLSNPMAFWTENDILQYISDNCLNICSVYGSIVYDTENKMFSTTGCQRTGCMFCGYGCHLDKEGEERFVMMKDSHPCQYEWIMKSTEAGGLGFKDVIDWLNENLGTKIKY